MQPLHLRCDFGAVLDRAATGADRRHAAQTERVGKSYEPEGTSVTRAGKSLRVTRAGQKVEVVKVDHRVKDIVWASAGPLVLVIDATEGANALLAAVVQTPSGMVTVPVE